jgi:hypothetical protein
MSDIEQYTYSLTFEDIPTPTDIESIPRSRTTMKRSPAGQVAPSATGDTLLIVGCALDGPNDRVISLSDIVQASTLYGPQVYTAEYPGADTTYLNTWNGNTLVKAVNEALAAGARDVRLLRVGGTVATGADLSPGLHVSALYAGASYNGASINMSVDTDALILFVMPPQSKGRPFTFRVPVGRTLAQICLLFNSDPRNQAFLLSVDRTVQNLTGQNLPLVQTNSLLRGGTYGTEFDDFTTPALLYDGLMQEHGAFDIARWTSADMVYFAGLYADDDLGSPTQSFVQDLGSLCGTMSQEGTPVLSSIGLRPLDNPTRGAINARVVSLMTPATIYDNDGRVNVAQFLENGLTDELGDDIGRYVSIVAGPDVTFNSTELGVYSDSPVAWYAALACGSKVPKTTTNKPVPPQVVPVWKYSHSQLNQLNGGIGFTGENSESLSATQGGGAYVTLKQKPFGQGWCVVEDVTAAPRNSPFSRLYVSRVLQAAEEIVQAITSPYVGQPNNSATIAALDRQLETNLDTLNTIKAVQGTRDAGYGYSLWSTVTGQQLGVLYLTLWILPVGEIHRIDNFITVT